jgi:hypothetical protein
MRPPWLQGVPSFQSLGQGSEAVAEALGAAFGSEADALGGGAAEVVRREQPPKPLRAQTQSRNERFRSQSFT